MEKEQIKQALIEMIEDGTIRFDAEISNDYDDYYNRAYKLVFNVKVGDKVVHEQSSSFVVEYRSDY